MTTQESEHIIDHCHAIAKYDSDRAFVDVQRTISQRRQARRRRLWASMSSIAAMLVVALMLWLPYQRISNDSNTPLRVQLPDQSLVSLNKGASIVFAKQMKQGRHLKLKGEAFFEITADAQRPFVITAHGYQVKVLGTSFNVKCIEAEATLEVMVESGTVEVSNRAQENLILKKGEFARGISPQAQVKTAPRPDANYLSWYQQKLVFDASPIAYVLDVIENTYHCQVTLESEALKHLKISTTFDGLSPQEVLTSICLTLNLSMKEDGNGYLLYKE